MILLGSTGYSNPYWLTFNQAKDLGGHIRRGEHATPVVFWKTYTATEKVTDEETGELGEHEDVRFVLRYYNVFNVEQCEGIPAEKIPALSSRPFEPIQEAERVAAGMPNRPGLEHHEARAYYRPSTDTVNMPRPELFTSPEEYYSTLFHELTHSTGHTSRLNRFDPRQVAPFGSKDYSQEELVAEMGAAFLCAHCGIENRTLDNSAAYILGWLRRLRNDRTLVIFTAAQAQKAADFILASNEPEGRNDHH